MPIYEKIKVVLADELDCYRKGLKLSLKKNPRVEIIGEASTDEDLTKIIIDRQPHVVLIDVHLSNIDSVAFIRRYTQQESPIRFIVLSQNETESYIANSVSAGAVGYISKDTASDEIATAIEEVYIGNSYYSKRIAHKLFKLFGEHRTRPIDSNTPVFTQIEKAIIEGIFGELTNKEIADKLCLSVRTVEGHRLHILRKTKSKGTAGIVIFAIRQGLVQINR